jgi:hypothetical protein
MSDYNTLQKRFDRNYQNIKTASYLNYSNNGTLQTLSGVMKHTKQKSVDKSERRNGQQLQGGAG